MSTFTVKPIDKVKPTNLEEAGAILLQAVIDYRERQARIAYEQEGLKASRSIIEAAAKVAPGGKISTPQFTISLIEVSSERFDKEAAIEALGKKTLKPFMSTVTYTQLRVK